MKATALGALVAGSGWLCLLLAFIIGSLGLALVGLVLVAGVATASRHLRRVPVQVRRTMPERLEIGAKATIRSEATADAVVWVEDDAGLPLRVLARRHKGGRGSAWQELDVEAAEAGTARWQDVGVRVADPWGLHEDARRVGLVGSLAVAPEADWVRQGRRAGRKHTVQALVRGRRESEPTPQVAGVREFQAGDRLRDVDWARTARLQRMHSRVREKVTSRPVLVLLDATAGMRSHRRHSRITTAARLAYGVMSAAQAAGVSAGLIIFDESGLRRATRLAEAVKRLSTLDSPLPVAAPLPTLDLAETATRQERRFLAARSVLSMGQVPPAAPLDAAVGEAATRDPALIVAILDVEGSPAASERAVRRLRQAGHDVVLVVPATGAHHYRRSEATGPVLARLRAWRSEREAMARRLRTLHVPLVVVGPHDVEAAILEVAKWAK